MSDQVIGVTIKGIGDFSDVVSNVGSVQKALTKLKLPDKLGDNLNKNISNFMKEYDKYQKKIAEGIHTQGDQNAVNKSLNSMLNSYEKIIKDFGKISPKDFKEIFNLDDSAFVSVQKRIKEIQAEIKKIKLDPKQLTDPINEISKLTKANSLFGNGKAFDKLKQAFASNEIQDAKEAIADIQTYYDRFSAKMGENKRIAFLTEFNKLKEYVNNADQATQKWSGDLDRLEKELGDIGGKGLGEIDEMKQKLLETSQAAERVTDVLKKQHAEEFNFNREAQNIDRQIQSYFGLSQMIRKVGDIAKDAFSTVKELDKAMTQTAVVTNFSVGDMWEMLPTYTAQANQLGSTIRDVYEAATLYYQQGLNTNQAMGLANETLKMARIAGLDAAEATNMMTAALRGFNMEINQMSAQKVNDIYSELAAITASDTKEIGSAMERTASIANSANMDFATTSAFLAQMIETTREAPENLGTAMKTIVARFQEMKQDPTKLIDSEGVAMDANKVDKALKTIGVQLMNTKGEFRDLDDVFLDIASKWDSLSQGQQRYIATIAAGSRQQSRFIAMMSDYERTMELVDAANNSAGASQRQFEKTLDSMEAKLNMLKNAWDQFTMGLMNNQILKFGVDALTEGFTIVNKFIDILGKLPPKPFEGITKSVLTLVTTLGMLNLGKKASRGLIMGGAGWWKGETSLAGGFAQGWKSSGQTGFFKNRKSTTDAEQQGAKDGQAYGRGWTKAVQVLQQQRRGEILGVNQIELNKIQALPVGSIIEKLLPKEAITAEAAQQLQESIDAAGGNVHKGLVDYKHATGKGKILDINQGKQLQEAYDSNKVKKLETNFNSLTGTIGTAGSALMNFGMILQGTPLEPFGQVLTTVGGSLMSLSTAITTIKTGFLEQWAAATEAALGTTVAAGANGELAVSSIIAAGGMKVLGTAIWTALWPLLAVAVAIGAVVLAAKGLDAAIETNKEQLEAASDAAAAASEAYDSAKQETSELADSIDTIRETDSAFDGLVAGTAEFNEQLVTANEQIMALIDKYPMLNDSRYLSTDKNGLMHINEAGFKAVQEYQKQIQARASAMNLIQTADLNALENQQKAQQLRNSIKTNMSDDEQDRILRNADLLEQRAEAETKLAHLNAIRVGLVDKEIADQEKLASIYVDQYEAKKQVAEAEVEAMGKHDIRQAYADYHGYTYDKSTKKIKDVEGNEIDYDDVAIKDEVIEQTVMLDFEANASSLEGILHSLDRDFSKTLDKTFENSSTFISDVLSNNAETNEDLLEQILDNPEQLNEFVEGLSTKELAAVLGASEEAVESNVSSYKQQLEDKLLTNAQNIIDTNAQANGELAAMLAQAQGKSANEVLDNKNIQDNLIQQVKEFTSEQRNTLLNVGKTLEESVGSEAMATFINGLSNIYKTGNEELKTVTQDWVDSINWETATGRLKGYNEAINMVADDTNHLGEESVKQINNLGKALLESQDEANLLGEAFEEFYNSTDFQEMAENMDKFVDSSGQLNAASIMDMAEECHSLNNLLDTGAISAGGVAAALNALGSDGDLVLSDLNSRVLELLSNFGQLDDIIASSHRNIENFDWGIDTGEAEDFVEDSAKKWNELYSNGEVGNPQLEAYAKWVMGEDRYIALLASKHGDLEATMAEVSKSVNLYSEGFEKAWDKLAEGSWENVDFSDDLKDLGISVSFDDNGDWNFEPGEATTEQLQKWLQQALKIGPEMAQAMIEDWSNYSPNFRAERQKNDFNAGLDSYVQQRRGADGGVAITASELDTIVSATGQEKEDIIAAIAEKANIDAEQVDILKNIDENTGEYITDGAVLNKELTEAVGAKGQNGWLAEYQAKDSSGNLMKDTIDIENAMAAAIERGYTAAQAKSMAYESYTNAKQQGKDYYYKGELLEAGQYKTLDQFAARLEEIDQNEQWVTVGQAMADGFLNRLDSLNKPEEPSTESNNIDKSTSNIPKGTTVPGVGYVTADGKVSSQELTWKDKVPGWVAPIVEKIGESAEKRAEIEEAYKNVQGQTAEELQQSNKNFFDSLSGLFNTSINERTGYTKETEPTSDTQTNDNLTTGSEALTQAATQLISGIESLGTAGEALNTAASNLTNAAAVLSTINQGNGTTSNGMPTGISGPPAPNQQSSASGIVVVDNSPALASFEELQSKATEVKTQIETPMNVSIGVEESGLKNAADRVKTINDGVGSKNISVTATASDPTAVNTLKQAVEDFSALSDHTVTLTTSLSGTSASGIDKIMDAIDDFHKKTDHSVTLTVNYKTTGTKTDDHQATGSHNHGSFATPSFGSAAGGYGQVGPKGKGGLTLTGELGYEIAWIPSENRSMILGANGPQMINLPGDAVVWTHEQSKKILKQDAIPAGSHSTRPRKSTPSTGGKSGKGKKNNKKNKNKKSKDKSEKEAPKLFEAVNVWWDNFARRTEAHQRIMDKASKAFEKTLKGFAGTADKAKTALATYQSTLVNAAKENNIGLQQAKNQLYNLDNGIGNDALALISYSATTTSTKKGKNGKKKTTTSTTSQQEFVNLGGYINYNAALDTYEIDQAQLDAIANLEQRKAIADAANQKLNDLLSKRNKAEEEIQKARDELDKVADTMYETFYSWEKSINEIYMLSKRLEVLSGLKEFNSDLIEFESAMMKTGYQTSEAGQNNITKYLAEQQTALKEQVGVANQLITAREKEFQNALKADTYFSKLQKSIESSDVGVSEEAIADYQAAVEALKIYENANGDMETAIQRLNEFNDKETNKDFYDRVQKVLDDIFQKQNDVVDASSEALKLSGEIFSQIEDYNDYIIDFQNDMLEGVKKQAEEQIDRLDTLNDSLSKALKNLLDEVKSKLDERRRIEDNAKTESEITRKQQRLAMLRADTSGGHQTEIAQLEKEIADSQQNYQRTLEDQLLDRLQEQADKAEQQRQQQIDLLQAANDVAASNGTTMKQIEEWLAKGDEASRNALKEAYRTAQGYYDEDTSQKERERIDNSFEEAYAKYGAYIQALPDWDKIAKDSTFTTDISNKGQTTIGGLSSTEVQTVHEGADEAIAEARAKKEAALMQATASAPTTSTPTGPSLAQLYADRVAQAASNGKMGPAEFLDVWNYANAAGVSQTQMGIDLAKTSGLTWEQVVSAAKRAGCTKSDVKAWWGNVSEKSKKAVGKWSSYKTGGLADYTGPAWLDGTPSKPELILNAKDTANFVALKDILSKAIGSTKSINNSYGGDNIFEININVDKIEKDYDVDRVADRVKKKILESSSYRNVTQVRNFR